MAVSQYFSLLSRKKTTIFFIVAVFLILALILTVIQPFKYATSAQVLVIQNLTNPDPYAAAKSTEYLTNILVKVIYSNSFFENVLASGYAIDKNYFGATLKEQMKQWSKTVSARAVNDTGIIALTVYHKDRAQADALNRAVIYTLMTRHGLYHGGGDSVAIKTIDEPIASNLPVKPNVFLNFGLALALGLLFAGLYVYFFPDEKYDLNWPFRFRRAAEAAEVPVEPMEIERDFEPAGESAPEIMNEFESDRKSAEPDDLNGFGDLGGRDDVVRQGSMKNIFGRNGFDD